LDQIRFLPDSDGLGVLSTALYELQCGGQWESEPLSDLLEFLDKWARRLSTLEFVHNLLKIALHLLGTDSLFNLVSGVVHDPAKGIHNRSVVSPSGREEVRGEPEGSAVVL